MIVVKRVIVVSLGFISGIIILKNVVNLFVLLIFVDFMIELGRDIERYVLKISIYYIFII